jgi:hypothetical protein
MDDEPNLAFLELRQKIITDAKVRYDRGEAVVGGKWWEIDPTSSFADASGVLVRECQARGGYGALALPVLFLQRHAVELILKALCRAAHDAASKLGEEVSPPDFDAGHKLDYWLQKTSVVMDRVGLSMPPTLTLLVAELRGSGDVDGQNWRYGREKRKQGGNQAVKGSEKKAVPAFPDERTLPVRHLQEQLDKVILEAYGWGDGEGRFWDLVTISSSCTPRDFQEAIKLQK